MRRDDARLLDMLLAAREAATFADGLTFEDFQCNRMAQLAILKAIEIVGEAASGIGDETKDTHPEIPWGEIVGMRNRIVHAYFNIDMKRAWDTVRQDIPRLILQLEPLVPPDEEP